MFHETLSEAIVYVCDAVLRFFRLTLFPVNMSFCETLPGKRSSATHTLQQVVMRSYFLFSFVKYYSRPNLLLLFLFVCLFVACKFDVLSFSTSHLESILIVLCFVEMFNQIFYNSFSASHFMCDLIYFFWNVIR